MTETEAAAQLRERLARVEQQLTTLSAQVSETEREVQDGLRDVRSEFKALQDDVSALLLSREGQRGMARAIYWVMGGGGVLAGVKMLLDWIGGLKH